MEIEKNLDEVLLVNENAEKFDLTQEKCNEEKFNMFVSKCLYWISDSWNNLYLNNANLNFINLERSLLSNSSGIGKSVREVNKKNFNMNYLSEEEIEKQDVEIRKSLNKKWISKVKDSMIQLHEFFYEMKNNHNQFIEFMSGSFNKKMKNLIMDVYEIIEPLVKEIQVGSKKANVKMNETIRQCFEKISINSKYAEKLIDKKTIYINHPKHNDTYDRLDPFSMALFVVYIYTLLVLIVYKKQKLDNRNEG